MFWSFGHNRNKPEALILIVCACVVMIPMDESALNMPSRA
jgi:hypothetical protein